VGKPGASNSRPPASRPDGFPAYEQLAARVPRGARLTAFGALIHRPWPVSLPDRYDKLGDFVVALQRYAIGLLPPAHLGQ
jgi:hypothetical protein